MYKKRENFVNFASQIQYLVAQNFLKTSFSQIIESRAAICYSYSRPKRSIYVELGKV